jgi:proprotein convertase subtilisin/kexin type 2
MKIRICLSGLLVGFVSACGGAGSILPDPPIFGATPPPAGNQTDTRNCAINYSLTQNPILTGADPKFNEQWHLLSKIGEVDVRATAAWITTKGDGTRVAVVDDAIETIHPDLQENVVAGASYNYFSGSTLPLPCGSKDNHGTEVAGIIAARDSNGIGLAGVAPRAKLVGFNPLEEGTDASVIDALQRDNQLNQIYHNSWGSSDDGFLHPAPASWTGAIDKGLRNGRGGKGSIFVFSSGNGGSTELPNQQPSRAALIVDNSNFDGYTNRIGVIAACASDETGARPFFGEFGANQLVCAPGYGSGRRGISTTGIQGTYVNDFIGTSASAPIVSGVVALMLSVNPNLTWRDVPIILAQTARKTNQSDANWNGTGVGRYSPFQGFGVVDAEKAVARASSWVSIGNSNNLLACDNYTRNPNLVIPDPPPNSTAAAAVDAISVGAECPIRSIEYIDLTVTSDHSYSGELEIKLISPTGTVSQITYPQSCGEGLADTQNPCKVRLDAWRFGVVRHLDETTQGTWRLQITDTENRDSGRLISWNLKFWGR